MTCKICGAPEGEPHGESQDPETMAWSVTCEDDSFYGDTIECLDVHDTRKGECEGPVQYHPSLAGTGTPIPRCERHWQLHLEADEKLREDYPDSDIPPAWFDPANAGERWNEDD